MARHPERIGRYEVQRLLGRGAMGMVYLAQDPILKRPVAIKVVQEHGEEQELTLLRFQREAEISARLNHPNIVTVFDVGQDPGEGPFMAMEYIEGSSLAQLTQHALPMELKLHILAQIMAALQAAAEEGIVHRDVKPENVLVRKDGRAKLMDFGIARRAESHLTAKGMFFGTPSYTAPELVVGGDASPATDRYAFAVTAFELLSGAVPFSGSSLGSTLYRIVHDPPVVPPDLPPLMVDLFLRALAKKPEDRHPDLATFMHELIESAVLPGESHQRLMALVAGDRPFGGTGSLAVLGERSADPDSATVISGIQAIQPEDATRPTTGPRLLPPVDDPEAGMATLHRDLSGLVSPWEANPTEASGAEVPSEPPGVGPVAEDGPALPPEPDRAVDVPLAHDDAPIASPEAEPGSVAAEAELLAKAADLARVSRWRWILPTAAALAALLAVGGWLALRRGATVVDVQSTPENAEILLEGRLVGHTPLRGLRLPSTGGTLMVRAQGFEPESRAVTRFDSVLTFRLRREPYHISVVTDPEGAEAFLNGQPVGITPIDDLAVRYEGRQELVLRRKGCQEWSAILDPEMPFPPLVRLTPQ